VILGLRTVIYPAADLDATKAWYTKALGREPYFAEPFYVGFEVGGFELGLDPNATPSTGGTGVLPYWGVADCAAAYARLLELGATELGGVQDVGGGIKVASVRDPFGNALGIIENPTFSTEKVR
jgi:predicted enzyme related to lactoylglutathione lyase